MRRSHVTENGSGAQRSAPRMALVLGGGAARGLAHIGVMGVLERDGIRPTSLVGSSIGGLVGALAAAGLSAAQIVEVAGTFTFPRRFVPGGLVQWDDIFPGAVSVLDGRSFGDLATPLTVTAVDLESGETVILDEGPVLPAVRATCAVPGVLAPVRLGGRWLVDGGLVNVLPVDVAWMKDPPFVVAVKVGGLRPRTISRFGTLRQRILLKVGECIPNPLTARACFEILVRASEIVLDRQATLAAAMTGADLIIEPDVGDLGLRDFHRLREAVDAGRRAAETALPAVRRLLAGAPHRCSSRARRSIRRFDPVCGMVISPGRARAKASVHATTYFFCSTNCRESFVRDPERYLRHPLVRFQAPGPSSPDEGMRDGKSTQQVRR